MGDAESFARSTFFLCVDLGGGGRRGGGAWGNIGAKSGFVVAYGLPTAREERLQDCCCARG